MKAKAWRGSLMWVLGLKALVTLCKSKSHFSHCSISPREDIISPAFYVYGLEESSSCVTPPHLQLGVQICVRRHHMLVLFLPGDFDERLFGFPVLLLELVHHRRVLALDEAVEVISGVAAATKQTLTHCCDRCRRKRFFNVKWSLKEYSQISSLHFSRKPVDRGEQVVTLLQCKDFKIQLITSLK